MKREMELLEGIEPSTCALPRRRYTSEPQQLRPHNEGFIDKCLVIIIAHYYRQSDDIKIRCIIEMLTYVIKMYIIMYIK